MIYKGRTPEFECPNSNMRRVLRLMEKGMTDRQEMADKLGLTKKQVTNAIINLQTAGLVEVHTHVINGDRGRFGNGRTRADNIYRVRSLTVDQGPRPMANVAFIFWAANNR